MKALFLIFPLIALASWETYFPEEKIFWGVELPNTYQKNHEEDFLPASTAKILTAAAALAELGADFTFKTSLTWNQEGNRAENLHLLGEGDPTDGMDEFPGKTLAEKIAEELYQRGVREISGEIKLAAKDPRWNARDFPPGWQENDLLSCYGARAQAFNFNINCARFEVSSKGGSWIEKGILERVEIALEPGSSTSVYACGDAENLKVCGQLKKGEKAVVIFPVSRVERWTKNLLRLALENRGIKFVSARNHPGASEQSAQFESPPLKEILKPFLKNSIGILGEVLFKTLGARKDFADLNQGGSEQIFLYLHKTNLQIKKIEIFDGSGLSRLNRTSPHFSYSFLEFLRTEPFFPHIWEALAIAGVDGTLKNRFGSGPAKGALRGKTGTLNGVYHLVGYIDAPEPLPFVMLSSTSQVNAQFARGLQDRAGNALAAENFQGIPHLESTTPFILWHSGQEAF